MNVCWGLYLWSASMWQTLYEHLLSTVCVINVCVTDSVWTFAEHYECDQRWCNGQCINGCLALCLWSVSNVRDTVWMFTEHYVCDQCWCDGHHMNVCWALCVLSAAVWWTVYVCLLSTVCVINIGVTDTEWMFAALKGPQAKKHHRRYQL